MTIFVILDCEPSGPRELRHHVYNLHRHPSSFRDFYRFVDNGLTVKLSVDSNEDVLESFHAEFPGRGFASMAIAEKMRDNVFANRMLREGFGTAFARLADTW